MTETKTITRTHNKLHSSTREEFHRNFGGVIYQSDFNTDYRGLGNINGSIIAARIESDRRREMNLRRDGKV